jgi:hypothetical protein
MVVQVRKTFMHGLITAHPESVGHVEIQVELTSAV